jgi:hypothetical protein
LEEPENKVQMSGKTNDQKLRSEICSKFDDKHRQ